MGSSRRVRAALFLTTILTGVSAAADDVVVPARKTAPAERVETRLIQFEIRVSRKGAPVPGLTAKDFDIELAGKPLETFTVDDMCAVGPAPPSGTPAARPGSFIFYFDEPELTVEGRHRAMEVARLVAPALLARGHDILILRNGTAVRAETKWTHDTAEVTAALDRLASDPGNGDSMRASTEEMRAERLLEQLEGEVRVANMRAQAALRSDAEHPPTSRHAPGDPRAPGAPDRNPGGVQPDALVAQASSPEQMVLRTTVTHLMAELKTVFQFELQRTELDIERLRGAVQAMAMRGTPKGVVYFADTLRRDPGQVIVHAVNSDPQFARLMDAPGWGRFVSTWDADAKLRALIRDASSYDVRFYAVEGRGLSMPSDWVRTSQDTLASLALDTGGLYFLNGIAPERIADRVVADQSCWYLVSFQPGRWDTDRPLNLGVWPKQQGFRVQTRSALVIPSRETLAESRLIAAHFGDPALEEHPLSVSVYPVGGSTKRLQVLAQVRLPDGGELPTRDTLWDVGFELISRGETVAHKSTRVSWRGRGQPPVYQTTLSLPAGPYEILAVAHEIAGDSVRAGRMSGSWPESTAGGVALSVPALAQPQVGGIVQDAEVKGSGIVVRGAGNPVDPRTSLAIVTAACLSGPPDAVFRAERRLVGENEVAFAPMELQGDEGRCVQIRDLVAAGSLGAGDMTYFVTILSGNTALVSQEIDFDVAELAPSADAVTAPPVK